MFWYNKRRVLEVLHLRSVPLRDWIYLVLVCHFRHGRQPFWLVCLFVLRPSQPNGVMSSAVSLPNHTFTGQAKSSKRLTSIVHILSPETDNCLSWRSGRERMTVENISWSISTKKCCRPWRGLNPQPPGLQSDGVSNWATEAGILTYCLLYCAYTLLKRGLLYKERHCSTWKKGNLGKFTAY